MVSPLHGAAGLSMVSLLSAFRYLGKSLGSSAMQSGVVRGIGQEDR